MTTPDPEASRRTVSVVIPAWNAARFLHEAVASVLAQTHPVDELVVVNDGSEDDTAAIADRLAEQHPLVRVLHQDNAGPGAARDQGISVTSGEFVALLDADDRWHPEKIAAQLNVFASRPDVDAVFTLAQNWFDGVEERGPTTPMAGHIPSSILFRRSVLDRTGGFDMAGDLNDWVPWFLRLRENGIVETVPLPLVERRVHDSNRGLQQPDGMAAYAQNIAAALRRRRSKPPVG
jgi:glycosyltransferase involved in cell wall biosynthesis